MADYLSDATPERDDDPRAIRLTFSYSGDRIDLVDAQRLTMLVPPSDPIEPGTGESGFWLELRGAGEKPLFRQVMTHPIENDREVFPEDPRGEIVREPVREPRGAFSIVIPELTDARTVSFVGSPSEGSRRRERAREIARFAMDEVIRRAQQEKK